MDDPFETLHRRAEARPDADAVVDEAGRIRWAELPPLVENLCLGLVQQGMRPGKAVALLLRRTRHLPLALLGVLRGKATAAPLEPGMGIDRLHEVMRGSRPELLLYDAAYENLAEALLDRHTVRAAVRIGEGAKDGRIPWERIAATDAVGARFPELSLDAPVYHHWAMEADGRMRAAVGTVRCLVLAAQSAARLFGFTPDDRHLCLLPAGLRQFDHALRPLLSGGATVLLEGVNIRRIVGTMADEGVTVLQAPAYLHRLVASWVAATGADLPDLRLLQSCGHTSRWVERRVRETLGIPLHVTWSALETFGAALGPRSDARSAAPLRNQPCPGFLVRIADPQGQPAAEGAPGELLVRGGGVAPKRITPDGARIETRGEGGWLHTGVSARHSLAGEIELLGGPADRIRRKRQTIHLREIERCLEQHRGVMEAAVVAADRPEGEPMLAAIAQPDPDNPPDAEALAGWLARRLKPAETPDGVFLAERLPHLPLGGLDRTRLAKGLSKRLAAKAKRTASGRQA